VWSTDSNIVYDSPGSHDALQLLLPIDAVPAAAEVSDRLAGVIKWFRQVKSSPKTLVLGSVDEAAKESTHLSRTCYIKGV
jgi:hypothetical protein